MKSARKYAGAVARSNLDLESRVAARAAEEERTRRKRAAWIAKEVRESVCESACGQLQLAGGRGAGGACGAGPQGCLLLAGGLL